MSGEEQDLALHGPNESHSLGKADSLDKADELPGAEVKDLLEVLTVGQVGDDDLRVVRSITIISEQGVVTDPILRCRALG